KFIHEELSARLYEELDYIREAKQTKLYAHILKDESGVHVPEIVDDLSTGRLLSSEWLDGKKILDFKNADQDVRNEIALNMFRAWYVPFYHYGIIHGDPHLGNYTVRDDLSLNLLDFGCVRVFRPEFIKGVIDLYSALMNDDDDQLRAAFEIWGFENLSEELLDALKTWALFLYAPVMDDKVRKIGEVTNGIFGKEIAQDVHAKLKEHGGITIPREFVLMDRAALGLGSVFLHLKAEINWYQVFNELIQDFDVEKLRQQQSEVLQKFDLPAE
ncbi:MAG: AarF/ABC1/UbiB kinase family protein, partial [Alphaproteobacteria bacterium]|nr:AarF/ABC1/UbiB kinase family protein [Alphaproteobacteria bacterium]